MSVLYPAFSITLPFSTNVIHAFFGVRLLHARYRFIRPLPQASGSSICRHTMFQFSRSLIKILCSTATRCIHRPFQSVATHIGETCLTSKHGLRIRVFTDKVMITLARNMLLYLFTTVTRVFITLNNNSSFQRLGIGGLFYVYRATSILFQAVPHIPDLLLMQAPFPPAGINQNVELPLPFIR